MRNPANPPQIRRALRDRRLRLTAPRRALLAFLMHHPGHLTAGEILDGLRRAGTPLSVATVYQNLQALSRQGLLRRFPGPDGMMHYDVNLAPHHHLTCERCGRMADVEITGEVGPRPVPAADAGGAGLRGWRIGGYQVEFRGLCPDCRRSARALRGSRISAAK